MRPRWHFALGAALSPSASLSPPLFPPCHPSPTFPPHPPRHWCRPQTRFYSQQLALVRPRLCAGRLAGWVSPPAPLRLSYRRTLAILSSRSSSDSYWAVMPLARSVSTTSSPAAAISAKSIRARLSLPCLVDVGRGGC